ncbi:hypothetical protein BH10PLA2_BH10PLA2_14680 [soil metagenome]
MRFAAIQNQRRWVTLAVFSVALGLAAIAARPYAGGWNDGSRLATVESLVDYRTLAIDESVFVKPPSTASGQPGPYAASDLLSSTFGTGDKLYIDGHYYSDKSPVPALGMGLIYYVTKQLTGLIASERVDVFCRWLTVVSSGLAYAVSVAAFFVLFQEVGLTQSLSLVVSASFGLSTMALTYSEHVNNHILFLGVSSVLMLELFRWCKSIQDGIQDRWRLCWIGCLIGAGYTIDLGVGPPLIAAAGLLIIYQTRSLPSLASFAAGMLPLLVLHHAVNYWVGGSLAPANANPAYFDWPGCSFNSQNMTGGWHHTSFGKFVLYAAALLFGKRGFIGHNLPLFLLFPAAVLLIRECSRFRPLVVFGLVWSTLTWLIYAVNSTNSSGQCCSIRWFLPLLAPLFVVVGLGIQQRPKWRPVFFILSFWGAILASQMYVPGPWMKHMVPGFWQIQAATFLSMLVWHILRGRFQRAEATRINSFVPIQREAA